jgi:hypothetical protein
VPTSPSSARSRWPPAGGGATQLGFQFGGEQSMRELLANFAANEARRPGSYYRRVVKSIKFDV